jgi:hypothetical protein
MSGRYARYCSFGSPYGRNPKGSELRVGRGSGDDAGEVRLTTGKEG